ncbi:hypothetical protein, partial [Loktanella salsilacus]|uniref:hypothetical protein n=1 Tax=Loktanella salsilacus TaxID=195913 RepID=UPI0037353B8D
RPKKERRLKPPTIRFDDLLSINDIPVVRFFSQMNNVRLFVGAVHTARKIEHCQNLGAKS